jgi:hypothetical protein
LNVPSLMVCRQRRRREEEAPAPAEAAGAAHPDDGSREDLAALDPSEWVIICRQATDASSVGATWTSTARAAVEVQS